MNQIRCRHCGYQWIPRVEHPKACPDCTRRKPEAEPVTSKKPKGE